MPREEDEDDAEFMTRARAAAEPVLLRVHGYAQVGDVEVVRDL